MTDPQEPGWRRPDGTFETHIPPAWGAAVPAPAQPLPVEEPPPDPATILRRLRAAYTPLGWAIVYDGLATWTALRAGTAPIEARTPVDLRAAIEAITSVQATRSAAPGTHRRP